MTSSTINPPTPDVLGLIDKRLSALLDANAIRLRRPVLRARMEAGQLRGAVVVRDVPAELRSMRALDLIEWLPRRGPAYARRLNRRALFDGNVNLAAPLGDLTDRQREWLALELDRSEPRRRAEAADRQAKLEAVLTDEPVPARELHRLAGLPFRSAAAAVALGKAGRARVTDGVIERTGRGHTTVRLYSRP